MTVAGLLTSATGAAARPNRDAATTILQVAGMTGQAVVTYDPAKTNPAAIAKAITERSGFKAEVLESEPPAEPARAALQVEGLPRRGKHL